jgi:CSLREA domain-containing protein
MSASFTLRAPISLCVLCCLSAACTYTVDSTVDAPDANPGDFICARELPEGGLTTGDDGGLCTLRAAIEEANATPINERIEVPAGVYNLRLPYDPAGTLEIASNVLIRGVGAASTIIDAGHPGCEIFPGEGRAVFRITGGVVGLSALTVRGGSENGVVVLGGSLEMADLIVRDNFSEGPAGGGIRMEDPAVVSITRTAIIENCNYGSFGGGIENDGGELYIDESLIAGNSGTTGDGGIASNGILNLRNTTVSGNSVFSNVPGAGTGGIGIGGFGFLNNVTITNNNGAYQTDGVGGLNVWDTATVVLKNSIVAGNRGVAGKHDCVGALTSDSRYNLIGDSAGCVFLGSTATFLLDVDPHLGALADNGGPTQTHALLNSSPAREAGAPVVPGSGAADACEEFDQRGVPRPQGAGRCDMGAYEAGNAQVFVTGLVLVDADSRRDIQPIRDGELLNLSRLPPRLAVRAALRGTAGSVVFQLDVNGSRSTYAPTGNYQAVSLSPGMHEIRAIPYARLDASGAAGGSRSARFYVIARN